MRWKTQLKQPTSASRRKFMDLVDSVLATKPEWRPVLWLCPARKLDKMDIIELQSESLSLPLTLQACPTLVVLSSKPRICRLLMIDQLTHSHLTFERNQKVAIIGANGIRKQPYLRVCLRLSHHRGWSSWARELGYFEQEVEGGNRQTTRKQSGTPSVPSIRLKCERQLDVAWL